MVRFNFICIIDKLQAGRLIVQFHCLRWAFAIRLARRVHYVGQWLMNDQRKGNMMQAQLLFGPFLPDDMSMPVKGDRVAKPNPEGDSANPLKNEDSPTRFAHSLDAAHRAAVHQKQEPATTDVRKDVLKHALKDSATTAPGPDDDHTSAMVIGDTSLNPDCGVSLSVALTPESTQLAADVDRHLALKGLPAGEAPRIDVDPATRLFIAAPQPSKHIESVTVAAGVGKVADADPMINPIPQTEKGSIPQTVRLTPSVEGMVMPKGAGDTINSDSAGLPPESQAESSGQGGHRILTEAGRAGGKTAPQWTAGEALPVEPKGVAASPETQIRPTRITDFEAVKSAEEGRHSDKVTVGAISQNDDSLNDSLKSADGRNPILTGQQQSMKGSLQDFDGDHRQQNSATNAHLTANGVEESVDTSKETDGSQRSSGGDVVRQIVDKAVLSIKNGHSQVRIDLKPEFLGQVRMLIATDQHQVTLKILTELPVVKEMIENHIGQLRADLQSLGLEIDELDVFVADDHRRQKGDAEHAKSPKSNRRQGKTDGVDSATNLKDDPLVGRRSGSPETGIDIFG